VKIHGTALAVWVTVKADCMAAVAAALEPTLLLEVLVLIVVLVVVFVLFGAQADSFHQPVQEICNGIL
jgi:hypothetical protein